MEKESETAKDSKERSSLRRYIIAAVGALLLATVSLAFIYFTQEQGPDPASEKIIREAAAKQLNKDPNELTDKDFANITKFAIRTQELADIKLLEKFTNLENLTLTNIRFPARHIPAWMKILAKAGIFDLNEKFLLDIRPLENLSGLQELSLTGSKISNLQPIKGFSNLQILHIENTLIFDLEPVMEMISLKELYLNGTKVSNLEPIKKLTNMEILSIGSTQVSGLEPIKGMTKLNFLFLMKTNVSDLTPLRGLTNLGLLDIRNCSNITDEQVENLQKALPNLEIKR